MTGVDDPFAAILARQPTVVLDGGLATALAAAGADLSGPLWSARVLLDDPELIRRVHATFVSAGADVVTTASYQLSDRGLALAGRPAGDLDHLLARSVELAVEARDAARPTGDGDRPLVAASIGPYGAVLADGSEYRGDYGRSVDDLVEFHGPRMSALVAAGPDLLACETIPCAVEVAALAEVLAHHTDMPAWVSVTSPDGHRTRRGEPVADALAPLSGVGNVVAVGVNCCAPAVVPAFLAEAAGHPARHRVVYPNLGDEWDAAQRSWVRRESVATDPRAFVAAGADAVGGCCGTTGDHIRRLRLTLLG